MQIRVGLNKLLFELRTFIVWSNEYVKKKIIKNGFSGLLNTNHNICGLVDLRFTV